MKDFVNNITDREFIIIKKLIKTFKVAILLVVLNVVLTPDIYFIPVHAVISVIMLSLVFKDLVEFYRVK